LQSATHLLITPLSLAHLSAIWITSPLTVASYPRAIVHIWQELNGQAVLLVETEPKASYASIQKVCTSNPLSKDEPFVFGQLWHNVENACAKACRYQLAARSAIVFLRTQDFRSTGLEVTLSRPTNMAHTLIDIVRPQFGWIFSPSRLYRLTGVILLKLQTEAHPPLDLFGETVRAERIRQVYAAVDEINHEYGKYTVYFGSSFPAITQGLHQNARGDAPERQTNLLKGETRRRRLGLPFLGEVK
jgi:hypothetical protein